MIGNNISIVTNSLRNKGVFRLYTYNIGSDIREENMWNIDEAFLNQQAALHKTFYSSHSVVEATESLGAEIDHLSRNYQIEVIQKFF